MLPDVLETSEYVICQHYWRALKAIIYWTREDKSDAELCMKYKFCDTLISKMKMYKFKPDGAIDMVLFALCQKKMYKLIQLFIDAWINYKHIIKKR